MAKTLHFNKLTQQSEDLFKLVVIGAKRAKQINALRTAKYPLPTAGKEEETFEETPPEEYVDWDGMKKPVSMALDELMEGDINFRDTSTDDEDEDLEREL